MVNRRIYYLLILSLYVSKPLAWGQGTIIDNGAPTNKWILHNPEDSRKTLFMAPWHPGTQFWDFGAQTQFRSNGDALFSGNVGIGTSTNVPATSKLEVYGDFRTTTGKFSSIYSSNSDTQYPLHYINTLGEAQLSIGANWTGGLTDLSLINSNIANTSGGGISFWQMMSTNSKKMLAYMKGDGSVGFGGIIPTRSLEVRGVNPIFRIGNVTAQNTQVNTVIGGIEFPTSGENLWMAKINANVGIYSDQPYLTFHTGSTSAERVRMDPNGNVGIGTSSPLTKLHISGGGLIIGQNAVSQNTDGYLSLGDIQKSSSPTAQNWGGATSLLLNAQDYSSIGFHDSGNRVDFIRSGNGTIQLGYDGGWGAVNIGLPNGIWNATGNVGIGTANPGQYKLAVEGTIGAREVDVKTGSWADFVFANDYVLPPLTAVELHIKEKKHLPGIPSEAEVKEKGYSLSSMDAKLLQKIEELTLYIIEQQKQLDGFKQNQEQQKKYLPQKPSN